MFLTDIAIRNARPADKNQRLFNGNVGIQPSLKS